MAAATQSAMDDDPAGQTGRSGAPVIRAATPSAPIRAAALAVMMATRDARCSDVRGDTIRPKVFDGTAVSKEHSRRQLQAVVSRRRSSQVLESAPSRTDAESAIQQG